MERHLAVGGKQSGYIFTRPDLEELLHHPGCHSLSVPRVSWCSGGGGLCVAERSHSWVYNLWRRDVLSCCCFRELLEATWSCPTPAVENMLTADRQPDETQTRDSVVRTHKAPE